MKRTLLNLIAIVLCMPPTWAAPGKAEMRLHCLSLRFHPGTTTSVGLNYSLEITTDSPAASSLNGELAPLPPGAPSTHGCFYRLSGDVFFEPVNGSFYLNLPEVKDANTNLIADFFEVDQAVSATTTTGAFEDLDRTGKVTTIWSREAKSKTGTCRLTMDAYGLTFNLAYEILEFAGTLTYSTAQTNVIGSIVLTNALRKLSGKVDLAKINPNLLGLRAGSWTNETGQTLTYFNSEELDRFGSDYVDFFVFKDGDLATGVDDYALWLLRINDPNDANRNGIPDLSDVPVPRAPQLAVTRSDQQLLLSVSGVIGKRHDIERVSALGGTNWTVAVSLTLTNDPQTVAVPVPANGNAFWRVRAP